MMNNEQQQRSDYLYEQHVTHLTLQGKRPATIDNYSRALRRITHHLDKSPDTLTTNDLKRYLAQLIKTHSWSTVRIDCNGLRKLWVSYVSVPNKRSNACITRCCHAKLSLNLPLNTVNQKKPGMPSVANRVDALVERSRCAAE